MPYCSICNRPLSDKESIRRGIGPDCWADMQARIEARRQSDETEYLPYQPGDDIVLKRLVDYTPAAQRASDPGRRRKQTNVPRVFVHHSPDGFEWGYGGSGPADLAFNILLLFAPANVVQQHYQDFKWQFIATMPEAGGIIKHQEIKSWLASRTADLFSEMVEGSLVNA